MRTQIAQEIDKLNQLFFDGQSLLDHDELDDFTASSFNTLSVGHDDTECCTGHEQSTTQQGSV
jgi:hypothetical protein